MATIYNDLVNATTAYYGQAAPKWEQLIESSSYTSQDFYSSMLNQNDISVITSNSGNVISYDFASRYNNATGMSNIGQYANSNQIPSIYRDSTSNIKVPFNADVNQSTGTVGGNSGVSPTATSSTMNFISGSVIPAIAATGVGISLGKAIDSTLYNLNPDFWDSNGMSSLNPETWSSITTNDTLLGTAFNMIFGLNKQTNTTQAYIEQNAFAYLAQYMYMQGVFSNNYIGYDIPIDHYDSVASFYDLLTPNDIVNISNEFIGQPSRDSIVDPLIKNGVSLDFLNYFNGIDGIIGYGMFISPINRAMGHIVAFNNNSRIIIENSGEINSITFTNVYDLEVSTLPYGNNPASYLYRGYRTISTLPLTFDKNNTSSCVKEIKIGRNVNYLIIIAFSAITKTVEGITNQDDSTQLDVSSNPATVADMLALLQAQFPDLFNNAITQNVIQPDGTVSQLTYIPVGMPEAVSATDTQPVTGTATQALPQIDPLVSPLPQIATLLENAMTIDSDLPPDTGKGETPIVVPPIGSVNSLWAIYNPSESQVRQFGSWLWSSNFIDMLLKMFNNPMESIITLHKVFVTPNLSGIGTIHVGYLDSNVPTNIVSNQYASIDCGSIDLPEFFGSRFDYSGYTSISLYLPFVGIVPLRVADVMRSTVSISYKVDIYTGTVLANVNVQRDNSGGCLYTYSGNCAVHYPLTNGTYIGMIGGLISGMVNVYTGNYAGAISSVMSSRASVGRSGNFSGNSGAMGIKKPYLIITRPQIAMPSLFPSLDGVPSNNQVRLGSCEGYVKVKSVHVENIACTNDEKQEIEEILKEGIII